MTLASRLQNDHPSFTQLQAVEFTVKKLTGYELVAPANIPTTEVIGKRIQAVEPAEVATPGLSPASKKNWERRLRSIGPVDWTGKLTSRLVQDGIKIIDRHVGLARREQLLKLRADLRRQGFHASAPKLRVVSGGVPSLGKQR